MGIQFISSDHEVFYRQMLDQCKKVDCYHRAFFYLTGLVPDVRTHIDDVFDFQDDGIRPEGLQAAWQTSGSMRACRLAFNLWNGFGGEDGVDAAYLPDSIFSDSLAPYFVEGLRLRFDHIDWHVEATADLDIQKQANLLMKCAFMSEQEKNRIIDTGAFNEIIAGYLVLALQDAGRSRSDIKEAVRALHQVFDDASAEQARRAYKGL